MTGALVLFSTLAVASALGLLLKNHNGKLRAPAAANLPAAVRAALDPAAAVTLVQLSTTFCAPCRQARALLSDLAARTDGLHHAELDLTERPELARELSVLRTPTTLAISGSGAEILRVGGVPRRAELLAALAPHLG